MKESSACPKCKGRKLWIIEPFRIPNETIDGTEAPVVVDQAPPRAGVLRRAYPVGRLDLYVCAACGYSELWAAELEALEHRPQAGVTLRDSTDPNAGPFR